MADLQEALAAAGWACAHCGLKGDLRYRPGTSTAVPGVRLGLVGDRVLCGPCGAGETPAGAIRLHREAAAAASLHWESGWYARRSVVPIATPPPEDRA